MNVETGAEAALFPEKEYINGIAVAVYGICHRPSEFLISLKSFSRSNLDWKQLFQKCMEIDLRMCKSAWVTHGVHSKVVALPVS